jgi:hypothetical protein
VENLIVTSGEGEGDLSSSEVKHSITYFIEVGALSLKILTVVSCCKLRLFGKNKFHCPALCHS